MSCYGCINHLENQQAHMMSPGDCLYEDEDEDEDSSYILYTDGACRGNPGICTGGAALYNSKMKLIDSISILFGLGTNNEAEYKALIEGMKMCKRNGIDPLTHVLIIRCDSELLVRQLTGQYTVRKEHLKELVQQLKDFNISDATLQHIPREENSVADKLANDAF
jgi:ribonuclease HI